MGGSTQAPNLPNAVSASMATTRSRADLREDRPHAGRGSGFADPGRRRLVLMTISPGGVSWSCSSCVTIFTHGAYIGAAYWFTSSTSFANPAVTVESDLLRHLRGHRARLRPRPVSSPPSSSEPSSAWRSSPPSTRTPPPLRTTSSSRTPLKPSTPNNGLPHDRQPRPPGHPPPPRSVHRPATRAERRPPGCTPTSASRSAARPSNGSSTPRTTNSPAGQPFPTSSRCSPNAGHTNC